MLCQSSIFGCHGRLASPCDPGFPALAGQWHPTRHLKIDKALVLRVSQVTLRDSGRRAPLTGFRNKNALEELAVSARLHCLLLAVAVVVCSGCEAKNERPIPPGTPVSGAVKNITVRNVVYLPPGKNEGVAMEVLESKEGLKYKWAVPPGEYEVYAYITGARALVGKVTVGSDPVTMDIPDSLPWKEVHDAYAGTKADVARPQ